MAPSSEHSFIQPKTPLSSALLIQARLQLVSKRLRLLKFLRLLSFLEDHQVEEVFEFGDFECLEASLGPHVLHELVDVLEAAQHLSDEELTSGFQHSVGLNKEIREVRAHETQAEDADVNGFLLEGHVCNVCLDDVIGAFTDVEAMDAGLVA